VSKIRRSPAPARGSALSFRCPVPTPRARGRGQSLADWLVSSENIRSDPFTRPFGG
jgi:hypothetical protein